jgi:hypothetical protein
MASPQSPTPSPTTAAPPRIVATLAFDYRAKRTSTLLRTLRVKGVPSGSTVTARCPKGCARIRASKAPQVTTRCLPPGASKPARCTAQR